MTDDEIRAQLAPGWRFDGQRYSREGRAKIYTCKGSRKLHGGINPIGVAMLPGGRATCPGCVDCRDLPPPSRAGRVGLGDGSVWPLAEPAPELEASEPAPELEAEAEVTPLHVAPDAPAQIGAEELSRRIIELFLLSINPNALGCLSSNDLTILRRLFQRAIEADPDRPHLFDVELWPHVTLDLDIPE